jgi:thiosulfate dehydrogenase (quinone) large subunit
MGEQTRIAFLLPLRLFCGWVFLNTGVHKLSGGWLGDGELSEILGEWLRDGKPYAFYVPFLRDVVLPHAHLFSCLVAIGELLVGAALLAGLFTRLAAFVGLVMVGNFLLGHGDGLAANGTAPMAVMMLTMMATAPGRTLGLDAALRGRLPTWLA